MDFTKWEIVFLFIREHELYINEFLQNNLKSMQELWMLPHYIFDTSNILDFVLPFIGCFWNQLILDKLIFFLGILNLISSLIKWTLPEYRPNWWLRELIHNKQQANKFIYFPQGCETSSGFPTTTILLSMTLLYILLQLQTTNKKLTLFSRLKKFTKYAIFVTVLGVIWISSLYLLTEFLHQCLLTTLLTWFFLQKLEKLFPLIRTWKRKWVIISLLGIGCIPISIYIGKLNMEIDPHWSVRMAFKWCENRNYLRYESSPVFSLARDFGYMMGIAFSLPIHTKRIESGYQKRTNFVTIQYCRRMLFLIVLELLNFYCRQETPKHHGRFVFVGYEFFRNLIHSYTLLIILPKLTN